MSRRILPDGTYYDVIRVVEAAQRAGLNYVEQLHGAGLILDPDTRAQIQVETLTAFQQALSSFRPAEYIRRIPSATPTHMYEAISDFLQKYIEAIRKEGGL